MDHLDSTLSARAGLSQAEGPYEDETSSGERVFSTEAAVVEDPCSEINESRVNHAFKESLPEETEFGFSQLTQSLEQENQPERNSLPDETEASPTHPCESSAPSEVLPAGKTCPSRSPPAPALEADDHSQYASHPNLPEDSEQKPLQVEEVNRANLATKKTGGYPRRIRRRPNKFNDDFLCKLEEGNYSVSTLVRNQAETLLESIEHLKFNDLTIDPSETKQKQIEPKTDMVAGNVNLSKRGVEPVALKVYHWFDDYENLDVTATLSPSEVKELINQGKVAKNHSITELEILWEDLESTDPISGIAEILRQAQEVHIPERKLRFLM